MMTALALSLLLGQFPPYSPGPVINGVDGTSAAHSGFINSYGALASSPYSPPSYSPAIPYYAGNNGEGITAADFNGDGNPDLAVVSPTAGKVYIYLGTPTGIFNPSPSSTLTAGGGTRFCAVADFNNDGNLDLACTNRTDGTVSVFLGTGAGTFGPGLTVTGLANNQAIAAGVFGSGGTNASFVTCNRSSTACAVYVSTGTGAFDAGFQFDAGVALTGLANVYQMQAVDLDADGILDLVQAGNGVNQVGILLGSAVAQTFTAVVGYPTSTINSVAVGDVNGDNIPDVVSTSGSQLQVNIGAIYAAPGAAQSKFNLNNPQIYMGDYGLVGGTQGVALADINGDGFLDAIIASGSGGVLANPPAGLGIFVNDGYGAFTQMPTLPVPRVNNATGASVYAGLYPIATLYDGITPLDLNHDGRPDLVIGNFYGAGASGNVGAIPTFYTWLSTAITQVALAPGSVVQVNPHTPAGPPVYSSVNCVSKYATYLGQGFFNAWSNPSNSLINGRRQSVEIQTQYDTTPVWIGGPNVVACQGCSFSISDAGFTDGGPGQLGEMLVPTGTPATASLTKAVGSMGSLSQNGGLWCIKGSGAQDGTPDGGMTVVVELRQ